MSSPNTQTQRPSKANETQHSQLDDTFDADFEYQDDTSMNQNLQIQSMTTPNNDMLNSNSAAPTSNANMHAQFSTAYSMTPMNQVQTTGAGNMQMHTLAMNQTTIPTFNILADQTINRIHPPEASGSQHSDITAQALLQSAINNQQTSFIQLDSSESGTLLTCSPGEKLIIDYVTDMASRMINIESGLKLLLEQKSTSSDQHQTNTRNVINEEQFEKIKDEMDLNVFETKLKTDDSFKNCMATILKSKFGNKNPLEIHTCGLELVDFCFTNTFWLLCSWAGGSKDAEKPKFPIKFRTVLQDFIKEIVRSCTNAEMVTDRAYQDFFKNKFKNRNALSHKSNTLKRPAKRNRVKKPLGGKKSKTDESNTKNTNDGISENEIDAEPNVANDANKTTTTENIQASGVEEKKNNDTAAESDHESNEDAKKDE